MSSPQVVKIGNITVNVAQFAFAEYTEAARRPPADSTSANPAGKDLPAPPKPAPLPATLKVTFVGGMSYTFYGEDAEDMRSQLDILPAPS